MQLSRAQQRALDDMKEYIVHPVKTCFVLDGHAGTGKTTTLISLAKWINTLPIHRVAWLAPTGKASQVLKHKLFSFAGGAYIGTIHSYIFDPPTHQREELYFEPKSELPCDLMVVDEASMIGESLYRQLLDFRVPVIFVGDSFQLPPVEPNKAVGTIPFSVLSHPDAHLTEVFRQGAGNPILELATKTRYGEKLKPGVQRGELGGGVALLPRDKIKEITAYKEQFADAHSRDDVAIFTHTNANRCRMNLFVRSRAGYAGSKIPQTGERILCFRNDRLFGVVNGDTARVISAEPADFPGCTVIEFNDPYTGKPRKSLTQTASFGWNKSRKGLSDYHDRLMHNGNVILNMCIYGQSTLHDFDYGYTLTVHKAQGSEWDSVLTLGDDHPVDNQYFRWWYTAITRAKKTFVGVI